MNGRRGGLAGRRNVRIASNLAGIRRPVGLHQLERQRGRRRNETTSRNLADLRSARDSVSVVRVVRRARRVIWDRVPAREHEVSAFGTAAKRLIGTPLR